jgi:hypothetical protein
MGDFLLEIGWILVSSVFEAYREERRIARERARNEREVA